MTVIFRHHGNVSMLSNPIPLDLTILERVDSRNGSQVTPGFRARVPRINGNFDLGIVIPALVCNS